MEDNKVKRESEEKKCATSDIKILVNNPTSSLKRGQIL